MNNRILLRIAADTDTDMDMDVNTDINTDTDTNIDTDIDTNTDDKDDFQFDFDNLFNNNDTPKSDIEKMVTEPMDMDPFDPYTESEEQTNRRISDQLITQVFNNLSIEARGVLKRIEDFKFKIIQARNMLNGDSELKTKIEQKQKILDSAAAQIYGIAFDLENYNLTPNYEDEQLAGESFPTMEIPSDDLDINVEGEDDEEIPTDDEAEENNEGLPADNMDGGGDMSGDLLAGGLEDIPPMDEGESEEA